MVSEFNIGSILFPIMLVGAVSLAVSVLLVLTQHLHGRFSVDTHIGIQKFHTTPTARVGGIAIVAGAIVGFLVSQEKLFGGLLLPLLFAGVPAFVFGLLEDITKRVSVRARLLATMACGVLGYAITGIAITDANVPGLDWLLGFSAVSVAFTAFAVGGVANAINIIDGFNGLSSGTVVIISLGFAAISLSVGDVHLVYCCLVLAATMAGFLVVNWPLGKLFLGDGGAYFMGFALAWIAVLMLERHPEISAWAPLLVCGYPILEVLFSMLRRRRRGLGIGDPDRLHLHSLVKRRLVKRMFPWASSLAKNSITGAIMWMPAAIPVLIATHWPTHTPSLVAGFALCAFIYSAVYARLTQFVWCFGSATTRSARVVSP